MTIQNIITFIGTPTIVIALIYIGRKLQVLDTIEKTVDKIWEDFPGVKEKVNTLWENTFSSAQSPRKLTDRGKTILVGSGIKEVIDEKKNDLLLLVKEKNAKNPYDAEQYTLQVVSELKINAVIVDRLKNGAFSVGADIDTVLLVGGFYLRDLIFPELGFSITDLDKPKPEIKKPAIIPPGPDTPAKP